MLFQGARTEVVRRDVCWERGVEGRGLNSKAVLIDLLKKLVHNLLAFPFHTDYLS